MAGTMDSKSAEELSKSIQAVKDAAKDTTEAFEEQLRIVTQMRDVMSQISGSVKDLGGQQGNLLSPENIKSLAKELDRTSKSSKGAFGSIDKLNNLLKNKFVKTLVLAEVGLKGFTQGFMGMLSLQKGIFGFFGGVASGLFNIGKSILAIPFKVMDGLFSMAKRGGNNELRAALEEVRDLFGDLKSESAMAVQDVAYNMGKFDKSGVTSWQIFGNLAERMKAVTALAKGLGATFQVFQGEIDKNGEAIMRYQRGLGLTDEMMGSIASNAIRMGKGIEQVQNEMTKQALGMSKAFGVNAKVISRDMGKAMQDLAHFGHLSTKELGIAATFANKLGISVDKLTSMMDATKTFDQAAEGMSKLNEQYGTNIDATKMMMAQSPAEKFALISKGFRDAGKDLSKLTYQDREFIKAQAGMTDEALNAMIANKDAGTMFDKMSKEGDKNEKKVLSQADAMHELADSIKRLTPHGDAGRGGILKHFLDGIARGLQTTPEFMKLMRNINVIFRDAIMYGVKLGKMIFGLDNGMRGVVGGLADAFNPVRYRKMFQGVLDAFAIFKKDGVENMDGFMKKIHDVFVNFFMGDKPAGSKMLSGFKKFGTAVVAIFAGIGSWVVKELTQIIPKITAFIPELFKFIKDPKKAGLNIESSAPAWVKPLAKLFNQIRTDLWPVLKDLFNELWNEAGPYIKKGLKSMFLTALEAGAIKAALNMAFTALAGVLWNSIVVAMTGTAATGAGAGIATAIGTTISGALTTVASGFTAILGTILAPALIVAAIAYSGTKVSDAIKNYSKTLEEKGFDPATAKIAAGTTGLINTLTFGLLPKDLQGRIAESIAGILKAIFSSLDKVFGPSFSTSIKNYLEGFFDIFSGLGDLLKSMWKGDSKGVMDALGTIGSGIIKGILGTLDIAANTVLKLGPLILEYLMKALEMVSSKIGDIFLSLKEIYIIGPIAELIGEVFKFVAKIFNASGQGWKLIGEFFKNIWINFEEVPGKLASWGEAIIEGITSPFKKGWQKIKDIFGVGVDKVKDFLGIHSPSKLFQEIGKNMADGVDQSLQKVPENAEKTFKKTAEVTKSVADQATSSLGSSSSMNSQDVEVATRIISMITDLIRAIGSAVGGTPPAGEINSASVQAITSSVPTIMSLIDGIKSKAGPLVSGISEVIKSIPNDPAFKNKLKFSEEFFDFIGRLTKITSDLDTPNQIPGQGPVNSVLLNLDWINTLIYGMTHNWMAKEKGTNSIKNIVNNLKEIFSFIPTGIEKEIPKITNLLSGVSALISAFSDPFKGVSLQENQSAVNSVLVKLNEVDILMRGMTHNWMADGRNSIQSIVDNAKSIASAVSATAKRDAVGSINTAIKTVEDIVTATQKMDNALSNLPKINLQTKLSEVAGIAGLGAKGIYTVQSKEVVINVEFNVTMEVDKVEQILVSRTSSIIRDRINYAIKNSAQNDKSTNNAYIKKFGPQTGFYASDVDK